MLKRNEKNHIRFFKLCDSIRDKSDPIPNNAADHWVRHLYDFLKSQTRDDESYSLGLGKLKSLSIKNFKKINLALFSCQKIESSHNEIRRLLQQQNIQNLDPSHSQFNEKLLEFSFVCCI